MKKISVFLTFMMVFMIGSVPMSAKPKEVVLKASQVTSAADIESAIEAVTKHGTRPGIVTLDASEGDFVYTDTDRTIDIQFSQITLRSKNGAVIQNCEHGIFLDSSEAYPANGIRMQGITFYCEFSGVLAYGGHQNIVIQDNTFYVRGIASGVWVYGGENWSIAENYIESLGEGVYVLDSSNIGISANQVIALSGDRVLGGAGVVLDQSTKVKVAKNEIYATWYGIVLGPSASYNHISANNILSAQIAGITFKGGNEYNRVLANTVHCTWSYVCELYTVDTTYTPFSPTNKIAGNKLIPAEDSNTFTTRLLPGTTSTFKLGPSLNGSVYLVDVTPLDDSRDGAHVPFVIEPTYDWEQWNDVLRLTIPAGALSEEVRITVYELTGLETIMDVTNETLYSARQFSYPISHPMDHFPSAYFVDLDPQGPPRGGYAERWSLEQHLIHPEFLNGEWIDTLRIQTQHAMVEFDLHIRVYKADHLPIVSDFNVTLTKNDIWRGFIIGPSSLERGYVIRAFPLNGDTQSELDYYTIQPEFNGQEWNDVLRIRMGNLNGEWESIEYNFKVYACDPVICP